MPLYLVPCLLRLKIFPLDIDLCLSVYILIHPLY